MDKKILDLAHKTAKDLFSKYLFPWESEEDIRKREKLVGDSLLVCLHLLYNYESDFCDFSKCDFILDEISHAEKIDDKSLKALKCETEIYQLLQESHEMKNCLGKKQPSLFFKVEREMIERRNEEIKEMEIYKDFDFTFFFENIFEDSAHRNHIMRNISPDGPNSMDTRDHAISLSKSIGFFCHPRVQHSWLITKRIIVIQYFLNSMLEMFDSGEIGNERNLVFLNHSMNDTSMCFDMSKYGMHDNIHIVLNSFTCCCIDDCENSLKMNSKKSAVTFSKWMNRFIQQTIYREKKIFKSEDSLEVIKTVYRFKNTWFSFVEKGNMVKKISQILQVAPNGRIRERKNGKNTKNNFSIFFFQTPIHEKKTLRIQYVSQWSRDDIIQNCSISKKRRSRQDVAITSQNKKRKVQKRINCHSTNPKSQESEELDSSKLDADEHAEEDALENDLEDALEDALEHEAQDEAQDEAQHGAQAGPSILKKISQTASEQKKKKKKLKKDDFENELSRICASWEF